MQNNSMTRASTSEDRTKIPDDVQRREDNLKDQLAEATLLLEDKHYEDAIAVLESAVCVHKQVLPEGDPDLLALQHTLGVAYRDTFRWAESVTTLQHVVKIGRQMLHGDDPSRLKLEKELAASYRESRNWEEVVTIMRHVVRIQTKLYGSDHEELLSSQELLMTACRRTGRAREAVPILQHVISIRERVNSKDHLYLQQLRADLSRAYFADRQVQQGLDMLRQMIRVEEGEDAENVLTSRYVLLDTFGHAYDVYGGLKEISVLQQRLNRFYSEKLQIQVVQDATTFKPNESTQTNKRKTDYTISEDLSGDMAMQKKLCILKERPNPLDLARALRDRRRLV